MQIIYVHGLHSSPNSAKGNQLRDYCAAHHPEIVVQTPDLNWQPEKVLSILRELIAQDKNTVLVGSSLGGFFSTLLHNELGIKIVLLNPSTQPYVTLARFFPENWRDLPNDFAGNDTKSTTWKMNVADLKWFEKQRPQAIRQPEKVFLLVATDDEVIDYRVALEYYQGAKVDITQGGDHRLNNFEDKLADILAFALAS